MSDVASVVHSWMLSHPDHGARHLDTRTERDLYSVKLWVKDDDPARHELVRRSLDKALFMAQSDGRLRMCPTVVEVVAWTSR